MGLKRVLNHSLCTSATPHKIDDQSIIEDVASIRSDRKDTEKILLPMERI